MEKQPDGSPWRCPMDIVLWSPPAAAINAPTAPNAVLPVVSAGGSKGLWIDPVRFLALIDGWALAQWACTQAVLWRTCFHPALPSGRHPGGAPPIYRDETVLLTVLVMRAWRLSLEKVADWLGRY